MKPPPRQQLAPGSLEELEIVAEEGDGFLVEATPAQAEMLSARGAMVTAIFDAAQYLDFSDRSQKIPAARDIKSPPDVPDYNPLVAAVISRVSENHSEEVLQRLQDFETRYSFTDSCRAAEEYVHGVFEGYGLETEFFTYSYSRDQWRDIIGTQRGTAYPDRVYIICGHLDSITYEDPYHWAPGADDNGSGSTAVLYAAELLSNYDFDCTVKYICFTGEEQGLYGSYYWVRDAYYSGMDIRGVINLDMIAYKDTGALDVDIYCDQNSLSKEHANMMIANGSLYAGVDGYRIVDPGAAYSDHYYFWYYGYPAVMGIERSGSHWNPYYHTSQDIVSNCDIDLLAGITKMSLATLMELAVPDTASVVNLHVVPGARDYWPNQTLAYTGNVVSTRYQSYGGEVWADLYLPGGAPYPGNPILGPIEIYLGGYGSITGRRVPHHIPSNPPRGTYRYVARVGDHPDTVIDESEFEFTIH